MPLSRGPFLQSPGLWLFIYADAEKRPETESLQGKTEEAGHSNLAINNRVSKGKFTYDACLGQLQDEMNPCAP